VWLAPHSVPRTVIKKKPRPLGAPGLSRFKRRGQKRRRIGPVPAGHILKAGILSGPSCRRVPGHFKLKEPRVKGVQLPQDLQPEKIRA